MFESHLVESPEYVAKRSELQEAEIALMRQRSMWPPSVGNSRWDAVDDYVFEEGPRRLSDGDDPVTSVRLSELSPHPIDRWLFTTSCTESADDGCRCAPCGSTALRAWPSRSPKHRLGHRCRR